MAAFIQIKNYEDGGTIVDVLLNIDHIVSIEKANRNVGVNRYSCEVVLRTQGHRYVALRTANVNEAERYYNEIQNNIVMSSG